MCDRSKAVEGARGSCNCDRKQQAVGFNAQPWRKQGNSKTIIALTILENVTNLPTTTTAHTHTCKVSFPLIITFARNVWHISWHLNATCLLPLHSCMYLYPSTYLPHFGTCHGAPFVELVNAVHCLCKEECSEVQEVQLFIFSSCVLIQIIFHLCVSGK